VLTNVERDAIYNECSDLIRDVEQVMKNLRTQNYGKALSTFNSVASLVPRIKAETDNVIGQILDGVAVRLDLTVARLTMDSPLGRPQTPDA
jgi:hypothetical protein